MNLNRTRRQFLKQSSQMMAAATAASVFGRCTLAEEQVTKSAGWKAGVARTVITPEKAVWLAGYGSKRSPDGKLHDLWMKALALEDAAGHRAVLFVLSGQPRL